MNDGAAVCLAVLVGTSAAMLDDRHETNLIRDGDCSGCNGCPDGSVGAHDLYRLLDEFNRQCYPFLEGPPGSWCITDINGDTVIDFTDIDALVGLWDVPGDIEPPTVEAILSGVDDEYAFTLLDRFDSWAIWRSRNGSYTCSIRDGRRRYTGRGSGAVLAVYNAGIKF